MKQSLPHGLYLVATPIGNLQDITTRALEVLKHADLVACEDTRVTAKLLSHYGIKAKTLSYHEHNAEAQRPHLLQELAAGKMVALVSDAGTPLISDPGYRLVKEAAAQNTSVYPIPGACAAIAALTGSGLPTDRFMFAGFLPTKQGEKRRLLETIGNLPTTLIFYDSTNRLPDSLALMAELWPTRLAATARELTKLHEEFRRAPLSELASYYAESGAPKGEVVIVLAPPQERTVDIASLDDEIRALLKTNTIKQIAQDLSETFGLPRNQIYQRALELKNE